MWSWKSRKLLTICIMCIRISEVVKKGSSKIEFKQDIFYMRLETYLLGCWALHWMRPFCAAEDTDECAKFPGQLCAHNCINTPSSYRCTCQTGFTLQADGRTCSQDGGCCEQEVDYTGSYGALTILNFIGRSSSPWKVLNLRWILFMIFPTLSIIQTYGFIWFEWKMWLMYCK